MAAPRTQYVKIEVGGDNYPQRAVMEVPIDAVVFALMTYMQAGGHPWIYDMPDAWGNGDGVRLVLERSPAGRPLPSFPKKRENVR